MKSYEGILLCSDFDDTIAVGGKVSKENMDAVEYFKSHGGLFTIISGRDSSSFDELRREMDFNAPYGGLNGSIITDLKSGEVLRRTPMRKMHVATVLGVYKKHPEMMLNTIFAEDKVLQIARTEGRLRLRILSSKSSTQRILDETWLDSSEELNDTVTYGADGEDVFGMGVAMADDFLKLDICKSIIHTSPDTTTEDRVAGIRKTLLALCCDEVDVSRSWPYGVEVMDINATKGNAMRFIKEYTGATKSVAIGNYENDTSMIRAADIGVAVGNSLQECIEAADIVTVPCKNHAVADLIYNYL